jgi:hypothetical protein
MEETQDYKSLLSEIIAKQIVILGPNIAVLKARNVSGLTVSDSGEVTEIKGDAQESLKKLVDEYVNLSGEIVKNALSSVFAKYPTIKKVE